MQNVTQNDMIVIHVPIYDYETPFGLGFQLIEGTVDEVVRIDSRIMMFFSEARNRRIKLNGVTPVID